jgi:hypothetical protein
VFLVGGAGGTKSLSARDSAGRYHIKGELVVADKAGIKDVMNKLVPLIQALSGARKLFLTPLSRYWIDPCCGETSHLTNYRMAGYLPKLGATMTALKEYIRDMLYTRHTSNFRVLCPNKKKYWESVSGMLSCLSRTQCGLVTQSTSPRQPTKLSLEACPKTSSILRPGTRILRKA